MGSFKQLVAIARLDRDKVSLIVIYSLIVGAFSLTIPIAAQALVNIVSFGSIRQPLFVLAFLVTIVLTAGAFFRIMHIVLIENIQQHLFVYNTLEMARLIPNWCQTVFEEYRGTEMMNRFFDIFTIQKSLAGLLISGISVVLQVILGMCLLAVYHPYLLLFDIILLISIVFIIWLPWHSALKTASIESDTKYSIAGWLEEIARIVLLFKFSNNAQYAYNVADKKISDYIVARQNHFHSLMKHIIGGHVIQVISSAALLIIGGILVIKNQLTLGQLVAAEIVVTAMGVSISKFGKYFENLYDLLTACSKVNFLLSLPNEKLLEKNYSPIIFESAPSIEVNNINFHSRNNYHILKDINFNLKKGERCVLYGSRGSGKSLLTEIMLGLKQPTKGEIRYNNIPLIEYSIESFRSQIAYIKGIQLYDGSIIENLSMGKNIAIEEIRECIELFDLSDSISRLESGLYTQLNGNQQLLSSVELQKLMLVRAAIAKPHLLVIDEMLDLLPESTLKIVTDNLFSNKYDWTVIATTRREDLMKQFEKRVFI